ncbi:MAG TPA: DDE-type integrase/transposase/recombinase [Candidatus Babeliaceae bacterium]|nr:DDE-type integrase/transposase/recombinase [Candidatus Babeliaceae bacterium]
MFLQQLARSANLFKEIQKSDIFLVSVMNYLKENKVNMDNEEKIKNYLSQNNNLKFAIINELLMVRNNLKVSEIWKIVIPDDNNFIKLQLLQVMHNPNHCGKTVLYKLIEAKFYWTKMREYVSNFVDNCEVCQKIKRNYHQDAIEKKIIRDQSANPTENKMLEPFSQITIDYLDLPVSKSGYTCLLVIIDRATRLIKAVPCKTHDTLEFVERLIEEWIFNYGTPNVILTDNGKAFVSSLVKQLYKTLDIEQVLSTPYNPQSHGLVERANQTIGKILRGLITAHNDSTKNWDKYINHVVFVMNTTINTTTGFSPYELVYGRKAAYPIDRLLYDDEIFESVGDYMKNLLNKQKINYAIVHQNLLNQEEKNNVYNNNNKEKLRTYEIGDLVYKIKNNRKNKLEPLYEGPYVILKKINDLCYQIRLADSDKAPMALANVRQLKPFVDDNLKIETAVTANQKIDDIMKEFRSIVKLRKPIGKDDYLTDAEIDLLYE